MATTCMRCGRALKNPKYREIGYGAVCLRKMQAEAAERQHAAPAAVSFPLTIHDGYAGERRSGCNVVVKVRNGRQEPLEHLVHHSPDGFNWGYGGSGPADLARSIIADVTGDENPHPAIYQPFKWEFVSSWGNRWEISLDEIRAWLEKRKAAIEA